MADERTYGFSIDDAQAIIQSISNGESTFQEIRPRGGGGSAGSTTSCCSLHLYPDTVNTFLPSVNEQTRRRWKISDGCTKGPLAAIRKEIPSVGTLVWPGGNPVVELDEDTGDWVLDVSGDLILYDSDDEDITGTASSITGTWKREVDLSGDDKVTLTMDAAL